MLSVKILFISLVFCHFLTVKAQERNFRVKSGVECEQLTASFATLEDALSKISQSEYRFTQSFKIQRNYGLKAGDFYSCDAINGYLVLKIDKRQIIYFEVPKTLWEELVKSNDPEYFMETQIKPNYSSLE